LQNAKAVVHLIGTSKKRLSRLPYPIALSP
jgi:hypothetical protein